MYVGIGGHVIGMIDGLKLESLEPSDSLEQNRDYNEWHSTVNRNLVLVWYPRGDVVDVGVTCLGTFMIQNPRCGVIFMIT